MSGKIHKMKPHKKSTASPDSRKLEPVSLKCACNRDITDEELARIYSGQKREILEKYRAGLNSAFSEYRVTSCIRKAHFLAQVGNETGQLRSVREGGDHPEHHGYEGRGLLQLTKKDMYESYGKSVNHDFTAPNQADLEQPKWATDSAAWFWTGGKNGIDLNEYADKNDFIYITQDINGAFNGYEDRLRFLKRAQIIFLIDYCPNQFQCFNMETFQFSNSAAYKISGAAFGWGLWHDPSSNRKGTPKSVEQSLIGYSRFLELKEKQKNKRFGFTSINAMIDHAENRVREFTSTPN